MKNDYGFLCIGQAAGNIGSLFEEMGYNVLYINTSIEDLNLLKNAKHTYHVKGGEGCAKDRDKAKSLLANDLDTLINLVEEKLPQKMIFTVFASGGGTGSGLAPFLLEILNEEFNDDELIIMLSCDNKHVFHENCIKTWIKQKTICPICRAEIN